MRLPGPAWVEERGVTRCVVLGPLVLDVSCEEPGFCCEGDDGWRQGGRGTGEDRHQLNGEELVVGELLRVDDRCEEERKKCALATVMGLGLWDRRVVMADGSAEGTTERRWNV
jgi:hypothetical protein